MKEREYHVPQVAILVKQVHLPLTFKVYVTFLLVFVLYYIEVRLCYYKINN